MVYNTAIMHLLAFICALFVAKVSAEDPNVQLFKDFAKEMVTRLPEKVNVTEGSWTEHEILAGLKDCQATADCISHDDLVTTVTSMNQLIAGIGTAENIYGSVKKVVKITGTLAEVVLSLGATLHPFLAAIGPMVSLAASFGTTETDQMIVKLAKSLNQGFVHMEHNFDKLERSIDSVKRQAEKIDFFNDIDDYLKLFISVNITFNDFDNTTGEEKEGYTSELLNTTNGYYQKLKDARDILVANFKGEITGSDNVCNRLITSYGCDRNKVRTVLGDLYNRMLKAMVHFIRICFMTPGSKTCHREVKKTENALTYIIDNIKQCDTQIKDESWRICFAKDVVAAVPSQTEGCIWKHGSALNFDNETGEHVWKEENITLCEELCTQCSYSKARCTGATYNLKTKDCTCIEKMVKIDTTVSSVKSCYVGMSAQPNNIASAIYSKLTSKYYWLEWYLVVYAIGDGKDSSKYAKFSICGALNYTVTVKNHRILISSCDEGQDVGKDTYIEEDHILKRQKLKDPGYGGSNVEAWGLDYRDFSADTFYNDISADYRNLDLCAVKITGVFVWHVWDDKSPTGSYFGYAFRYHRKNRFAATTFDRGTVKNRVDMYYQYVIVAMG